MDEFRRVTSVPLARPDVGYDEVRSDIRAILDSGQLTDGPYVERFEASVGEYVGTQFAIATTSATTALHLALVAAGIGPGDEVLVPDFTFPATGNVIVHAGATPVLVDCVAGGFVMDVSDAGRKITDRTRAILPIDPFGEPVDMGSIIKLATRRELFVLEDAACALGAEQGGHRAGSWPDAGCFSFHPRKLVTTGEGGMVTTNDRALAEHMTVLRSQGGVKDTVGARFNVHGFNYRMSEIQAALGLPQMGRLDAMLADRRESAVIYRQLLDGLSLTVPAVPAASHSTYQSFVVMLHDHIDRNSVVADLRRRGIETTLGTYAMHSQPAFSRFGFSDSDLPHATRAQRQSLALPFFNRISGEVIEQVVRALGECLRRYQ